MLYKVGEFFIMRGASIWVALIIMRRIGYRAINHHRWAS